MDLLEQLRTALDNAARHRAPTVPTPKNIRTYPCSHGACGRPAYAGGLCNGHYLRRRAGADMDRPFKHTLARNLCTECGKAVRGKGGWGLCQTHYRRARAAVVKAVLIAAKGGRCQHCGGSFHPAAFDFHHTGPKEGAVSDMIANASVAALAEEVADCVLLCANCHRIEHAQREPTFRSEPESPTQT